MLGLRTVSKRVHSRYDRYLTATAGQKVLVRLQVLRLFCDNIDCTGKAFAEHIPGLAARHARRTSLLQRAFAAGAVGAVGNSTARLALGSDVSRRQRTLGPSRSPAPRLRRSMGPRSRLGCRPKSRQ
jgi:hypothetical protein